MDIHENARTTPHSRAEIVRRVIEEGESRSRVAQAFGVCCKTVSKWVDRFLGRHFGQRAGSRYPRFRLRVLRHVL